MSGGVGGSRRAIVVTRPDRRQGVPPYFFGSASPGQAKPWALSVRFGDRSKSVRFGDRSNVGALGPVRIEWSKVVISDLSPKQICCQGAEASRDGWPSVPDMGPM